MPIPFERFRLLNGSSRDITDAKYKRGDKAAMEDVGNLLDEQTVGAVPQGQVAEQVPTSPSFVDAKNIAISLLQTAGSSVQRRELQLWQLFYQEDAYDPEANVIRQVDLYVQDYPGDPGEFYALARVYYHDGAVDEFFSSRMTSF